MQFTFWRYTSTLVALKDDVKPKYMSANPSKVKWKKKLAVAANSKSNFFLEEGHQQQN